MNRMLHAYDILKVLIIYSGLGYQPQSTKFIVNCERTLPFNLDVQGLKVEVVIYLCENKQALSVKEQNYSPEQRTFKVVIKSPQVDGEIDNMLVLSWACFPFLHFNLAAELQLLSLLAILI